MRLQVRIRLKLGKIEEAWIEEKLYYLIIYSYPTKYEVVFVRKHFIIYSKIKNFNINSNLIRL